MREILFVEKVEINAMHFQLVVKQRKKSCKVVLFGFKMESSVYGVTFQAFSNDHVPRLKSLQRSESNGVMEPILFFSY